MSCGRYIGLPLINCNYHTTNFTGKEFRKAAILSLEDPAWSALSHAYGSAQDIPDLLRALALATHERADYKEEPWFTLWSALCHQSDVYDASYAALPHIVKLATKTKGPIDYGFYRWRSGWGLNLLEEAMQKIFESKFIALSKVGSVILMMLIVSFFSPSSSNAEGSAHRMLVPEIGLSIVCLQNPREEGWLEFESVKNNADNQYQLLVQAESPPDQNESNRIRYRYRLLTLGQPCFHEYESFGWGGVGTYFDASARLEDVTIDGKQIVYVFEKDLLVPIARQLLAECRSVRPGEKNWPFELWRDCGDQVNDILIGNTTSIYIAINVAAPFEELKRVIFVNGQVYYKGKLVPVW